MTAKKPAAPSKVSPASKAKPTAAPAPDKKKAVVADASAAKGKAAPKAVALVKTAAQSPSRASAKAPAAPAAKAKRGGKAAAEPAKKLPDMPADEDFADLEADAEVTTAADAETKAKAKPLRMKVSRAKERALMREFGLEEATLTEEEVAKRRHELKTLIKMGKTRGFLTHQEISDHLPEKLVDNEI
nr:RNA polymerase sigma factor region1.1 domain-containing protein [Burkholderiaceae bacterium]